MPLWHLYYNNISIDLQSIIVANPIHSDYNIGTNCPTVCRPVPFRWFESCQKETKSEPPLLRGCPSGETRKIKELAPSSWRQGTVHWPVPFRWFESRHREAKPHTPATAGMWGFGPSGETRTRGILVPNLCLNLQRGLLRPLWRFLSLQQFLFGTLLACLFQPSLSSFGICMG